MRSAARFQEVTTPFKSLLTMASSDDATRAARCSAAAVVGSAMKFDDCTLTHDQTTMAPVWNGREVVKQPPAVSPTGRSVATSDRSYGVTRDSGALRQIGVVSNLR